MRHGHAPALQPGFPIYAAHCKRHAAEAREPDSISAVARRTASVTWSSSSTSPRSEAIEAARTEHDRALQYIDRNAFKNSGIQGSVSISQPDEYVWIGMSAFDGCTGLTSVDVAAGNLYVDQEAFANCPDITEAKNPPPYAR